MQTRGQPKQSETLVNTKSPPRSKDVRATSLCIAYQINQPQHSRSEAAAFGGRIYPLLPDRSNNVPGARHIRRQGPVNRVRHSPGLDAVTDPLSFLCFHSPPASQLRRHDRNQLCGRRQHPGIQQIYRDELSGSGKGKREVHGLGTHTRCDIRTREIPADAFHPSTQEVKHAGYRANTEVPRWAYPGDEGPRNPSRLEAQVGPSCQPDGSKGSLAHGVNHSAHQEHVGSHVHQS